MFVLAGSAEPVHLHRIKEHGGIFECEDCQLMARCLNSLASLPCNKPAECDGAGKKPLPEKNKVEEKKPEEKKPAEDKKPAVEEKKPEQEKKPAVEEKNVEEKKAEHHELKSEPHNTEPADGDLERLQQELEALQLEEKLLQDMALLEELEGQLDGQIHEVNSTVAASSGAAPIPRSTSILYASIAACMVCTCVCVCRFLKFISYDLCFGFFPNTDA